jgi:SAM-dependent methyltransferase
LIGELKVTSDNSLKLKKSYFPLILTYGAKFIMPMEMQQIREHWDNLARKYSLDLKSTTKTPTIKQLEIHALARAIRTSFLDTSAKLTVLEVGCGNGHNIFGLWKHFASHHFTGLDYSPQMIESANNIREAYPEADMHFGVADILTLQMDSLNPVNYDVVFTDRCIINLNTWEGQQIGLRNCADRVKSGGVLIVIENFTGSYSNQNLLRESAGLVERTPDPYNRFIHETEFQSFLIDELGMNHEVTDDFGSLHDVLLYVLIPAVNKGKVDYGHPIMEAVTTLLTNLPDDFQNLFGPFGQNRLYVFRKP